MKKALLFFLLTCALHSFVFSQPNSYSTYLASGGQINFLKKTADGGLICFGEDNVSSILKLSSTGTLQWSKYFNTISFGSVRGIEQTPDGGYICLFDNTSSFSSAWVMKLDASGTLLWSKQYASTNGGSAATRLTLTSGNGFLLALTSSNFPTLIKCDATGNIIWQKRYSVAGYGSSIVKSVIKNSSGHFLVLSCSQSGILMDLTLTETDSSGTSLWSKTYNMGDTLDFPSQIIECSGGGYMITGYTDYSGSNNYPDGFAMKVTSTGTISWAKVYDSAMGMCYSVLQRPDNSFVFSGGIFYSTSLNWQESYFKTDTLGNIIWQKSSGNVGFNGNGFDIINMGINFSSSLMAFGCASDGVALAMVDDSGFGFCNQQNSNLTAVTVNPFIIVAAVSSVTPSMVVTSPSFTLSNTSYTLTNFCTNTNGVDEMTTENRVSVYPNPFAGTATIEINSAKNFNTAELELFDLYGRKVKQFVLTGNKSEISSDELAGGVYFYQVVSENEILGSGKIIIQK